MKQLSLFLTVYAALLAIASGSERADNTIILDETGVRNLRIASEWVEERDFESTVFAIGRIEEIPNHHSVLSSRVAGRVKKIHVFEGDFVEAGQVVAVIETRQLGNPPPAVSLIAPQSGLVTNSHIRLGQPVEPASELMDFSDRSKMWAVVKIPEQAAAQVRVGSRAHIRVPALGESIIEATLKRFGVTADRDSGTVEAIFELANTAGLLRPGLRVECAVVTGLRSNVLAVPRQSVQGDPSARVVFVKDFQLKHAFVRVPVVLGERNDRYVEVESGLFPGDEVITSGAYSLMFAGDGQKMSLKDALDAAHGHEHNEDGSEITSKQQSVKQSSAHDGHDPHDGHDGHEAHDEHGWMYGLLLYAVAMTVLSVLLLQQLLHRKRSSEESA